MSKNAKKDAMEKIIQTLLKEGIDIPDDFEEKLEENANRYYAGKLPRERLVQNALKAASFWEEYCADESEYSKLVCEAIYSMASINAVAISSIQELKSYIGNFCKIKENAKLPANATTIASDQKSGMVYYGCSTANLL